MTVFGTVHRWEALVMFIGDIVVFYVSLWLALLLRHLAVPSEDLFRLHSAPFTFVLIVWFIVFFSAGLYEKHTTLLKKRIPRVIFNTQLINSFIAILFFYLIPYFGITPKTTLFIYLLISFGLIILFRYQVSNFFGARTQEAAILVGSGEEMRELMKEVNENPKYGLKFVSSLDVDESGGIDFEKEIVERVYSEKIDTIVVDTKKDQIAPLLPRLYNLMFSGVKFFDMHNVYEDIFDRVPLSLLTYDWFLAHISSSTKVIYDTIKRIFDFLLGLLLGAVVVVFTPFVWAAIKLDDAGSVFIRQERVGKQNKKFYVWKFRTMSANDPGVWIEEGQNKVTRVGKFLRKTSIDELPQFLNVLKGELSLVGPRSDITGIAEKLASEIPYYNVRHIVKPGITGWAQTHQHYAPGNISPQSLVEAKVRLAYDLYYAKNRSFVLDARIALQTLGTLFSRLGK